MARKRLAHYRQNRISVQELWRPNPDQDGLPNPQRLALESQADILGFGGAAGGGKTDLLLGLAATQHQNSIIFRRIFKNLRGIIERSRLVFNTDRAKDSFNEMLHRWYLADGRTIEFEAMQHEKDKENFRGRPHDFYGFDEVTEFSRSQVEFALAWMRSTDPKQRCRAIMTFNPPSDEGGSWVVDYFRPWIAYLFPQIYQHPHPARPGELRYFATIDGEEIECVDGKSFEHNGETIRPLSRTFIPAKLSDNPHLDNTTYRSVLQALPEPLRSQMLHGDFAVTAKADPWQVIPTAWVKAAQRRWMESERPNMPLSGVGVDLVRGGKDNLAIAKRYGVWFDEVDKTPGVDVTDGPQAAGILYQSLVGEQHIGYIHMDVIGIGSSPYDSAKVMWSGIVQPINVARTSDYTVRSEDNQVVLRMKNIRAEMYWRMRQALDPEHGDNLMLPPGNEIVADLCTARYTMLAGGVIQIEAKDEIKSRLGHSPDVGEAILLAHLPPDEKQPPAGEIIETELDIYKSERKRERLWQHSGKQR